MTEDICDGEGGSLTVYESMREVLQPHGQGLGLIDAYFQHSTTGQRTVGFEKARVEALVAVMCDLAAEIQC